nr:hypothetical protein [Pandoravirus belohorizontensis]
MPIVVVTPARAANPPPTPRSTIVPRGIPSTYKGPSTRVAPTPVRIASAALPLRQQRSCAAPIPVDASPHASVIGSTAGSATATPVAPTSPSTTPADVDTVTKCANYDMVPRQAALGALVVHADWSEACSEFVPRALAALRAHPALTGGAPAVHVDAEPCLCARYAVKGIPCVIFRARPSGPSWRLRGAARPFEIPRTRITGACSETVLAARIDAAVAAFCRIVPPVVDPAVTVVASTTLADKAAND